jgi:pyruvate/2-oxoglutarate dehydrogenase complex dihydrolipoamide dehydrogenase (E3) component
MVRELRKVHEDHTETSGAELIYGVTRFIAPRTVEIELRDGATRTIQGDRVFLDLGSLAAIPEVPSLIEATPMTRVELLELERLPRHLIVLGGGYVGLELRMKSKPVATPSTSAGQAGDGRSAPYENNLRAARLNEGASQQG